MQDKADVGFVDAHAKRIGCDHDRCIVVGKGLLVCAPFFIGKSGVIAGCPKTICKQPVADLFDIFACCTVNDAGAVGMGEQIIADATVLVLIVANLEIEIFSVKTGHGDMGIGQLQHPDDVFANFPGCRRGKSADDGTDGQRADKFRDF